MVMNFPDSKDRAPVTLIDWIQKNKSVYPFQGKYKEIRGTRLHYLDEGKGQPVFCLHGNPTWSFFYRNLVPLLSTSHRVIVPDHIGCGLSDRPPEPKYQYTLQSRVDDFSSLVDEVAPSGKVDLVLHDWGGMIGTAWAVANPHRVRKLVFFNTSGFSLPKGRQLPFSLKLCRFGPIGSLLVRGLNLFCLGAARYCSIRGLSKGAREGFLMPHGTWKDRLSVLRFVQDIPMQQGDDAYELVQKTERSLGVLKEIPKIFCWGRKDFVFDDAFLEGWKEVFPDATFHVFENTGHYLLEDSLQEIAPKVIEFLGQP